MDSTDVQDPLTSTFSTNIRDSIYFFICCTHITLFKTKLQSAEQVKTNTHITLIEININSHSAEAKGDKW